MRKLFIAAAALIAVAATPAFVGQSQAASSKAKHAMAAADTGPGSEFCKLAKAQRNAPSWNEYYHCLNTPARHAHAPAPTRTAAATSGAGSGGEFCQLAKAQRNAPSWNEYYGCLRR
jgi:hypothetical protein